MYRISVTLDTSHKSGSNVVHSESSPQLKSQLICFLATFCSQSMSMLLSLEVVTATDIHVLTPEMATAKKTRRIRRKEARLARRLWEGKNIQNGW